MKLLPHICLFLALPAPTVGVATTIPQGLRGANDHHHHHHHAPPQWDHLPVDGSRRRLDQKNPDGVLHEKPSSSSSSDQAFEAVGVIGLDFNPAYVVYDSFDKGPGLTVTSFFNVAPERDLVAVITDLDDSVPTVERLGGENAATVVWPNEARRAPDGMFSFEAVVVPQGWARTGPGRLVAFGVDTNDEIVIHQSSDEQPRFYHSVHFVDMNQDGLLDIVTVRSGYQAGRFSHPPVGELVWFRNPGGDDAATKVPNGSNTTASNSGWEEFLLVDGFGPDVFLDVKDMTGDGIPEIVATHFFAGRFDPDGSRWDSPSRITLYGSPAEGEAWTAVDIHSNSSRAQPRVADMVDDQGFMFNVEIVDLNADGRLDILATNHQGVNDQIDGRVIGVESPISGRLFEDPWTVHVLMEGIHPSKAPPGQPSRRLAPGAAKSFQPPLQSSLSPAAGVPAARPRPWIALSGDQASKAWVLKPGLEPWVYTEELLLDINQYYGENTTQTIQQDTFRIAISTIGEIGIREEDGEVTLYVPVFEATDIHIFHSKAFAADDHDEGFDKDQDMFNLYDEIAGDDLITAWTASATLATPFRGAVPWVAITSSLLLLFLL